LGTDNPLGPTYAQLNFIVTFSTLGGDVVRTFSSEGTSEISYEIPTGTYIVSVNIFQWTGTSNGPIYAVGEAVPNPVVINGGHNIIRIQISQARVVVSPAAVNISQGSTQQFSVQVIGAASQSVSWGFPGVATDTNITPAGLFTVDLTEPLGSLTLTATSMADPTLEGTATITVVAPGSLTGSVSITGNPWLGQTITADTSGLDGIGAIAYAWRRGLNLIGTDSPNYTLVAADVGQSITVTVTRAGMPGEVISAAITPGLAPVYVDISGGASNIPFSSLQEALNTITAAGTYTVRVVNTVYNSGPLTFPSGSSGRNISLTPNGAATTIQLSSTGSLFTIPANIHLTLGNGVTLQGRDPNTAPLVAVANSGQLTMTPGSVVRGNVNTNSDPFAAFLGGGVSVRGGTFTMIGGLITGNSAMWPGGGVFAWGSFTMDGGEISYNTATQGGGVNVNNGTFNMNGGDIINNMVVANGTGGGVAVAAGGSFTLSNGNIEYNEANSGGGVCVAGSGTLFEMNNGRIASNIARANGGGVRMVSGANFTLIGGSILGNEALFGGGVHVSGASFTMRGGVISGNQATQWSGGVHLLASANPSFTKAPLVPGDNSGIIAGTGHASPNVVIGFSDRGHAVFVSTLPPSRRETTVEQNQELSWVADVADGAWAD
jgi:hypothetical protein